jgi:hypothetical protein
VLVRHFPYRTPAQIDRRLAARGRDATTRAAFAHENGRAWVQAILDSRSDSSALADLAEAPASSWHDRVVPAAALDYDDHSGAFVINEHLMPSIPAPRRLLPRPVDRLQRAVVRRATAAKGTTR